MKIIFTYILLVLSNFSLANLLTNVTDTTTFVVRPSKLSSIQLKDALSYKTKKPLKIVLDGVFYIDHAIETTKESTIIDFTRNSKIVFTNNKSSGITIKHNNCVVKNGKIQGSGRSSESFYEGYGILIYGVDNCTVRDMIFEKISGNNILLLPTKKGCSNNKIINNTITDPSFSISVGGDEAGILLGYSGTGYTHDNNVIEFNHVDGFGVLQVGIGIIGHGDSNIIRNNYIKNCRSYGVLCYESIATDASLKNSSVVNNTIIDIGEKGKQKTPKGMGIYLMKSINSIVSGNKVYNTLKNSDESETLGAGAISISGSPNCIINGNVVNNSFMYGITSDYSFHSKFINNKISNTRKSGLYFINMNDVIVDNNTFENIGAVVFKGYFEHTSLQYIKDQMKSNKYKNLSTGNNFTITNNKIFSNNQILYFTGSTIEEKVKIQNKIKNNTFKNNLIIGNNKSQEELIFFREEIKGSNKFLNNRILK